MNDEERERGEEGEINKKINWTHQGSILTLQQTQVQLPKILTNQM